MSKFLDNCLRLVFMFCCYGYHLKEVYFRERFSKDRDGYTFVELTLFQKWYP